MLEKQKTTRNKTPKQNHIPNQWHIYQKFKYLSQMAEIILRSKQRGFDLASQIDLLEVFHVLKFIMLHIFMLLLFGTMILKY